MKYCTDDGKYIFDTEKEVFDYEAKIAAEKIAKEKLAKEKENRREEIKADYQALIKKIEQYNKDYSEPFTYTSDFNSSKNMYDLFKKFFF